MMTRMLTLGYGVICYLIFFGAFLYLMGFLSNMWVPKGIDSGVAPETGVAIAINLGLIALFGVQHSVMARPWFKDRWTRLVPQPVERSTYVLATSIVLILLYVLWQPMPQVIWDLSATPLAIIAWAVFLLGFTIVLLSTFMTDHFDLFGLRQVFLRFTEKPYTYPPFKIVLFYKFVRHPLYFGMVIAFFATPTMTWGHLLFAVCMTGYILMALPWEEKDLVEALGDDYRAYQQSVPRLMPGMGGSQSSDASG